MNDVSPTRRRRSAEQSFVEEPVSSKKRMRQSYLSQHGDDSRLGESMVISTPNPGSKHARLRNPRVAEIQEQEVLNTTSGISFNGQDNLESPLFDRSRSSSFFTSVFDIIEPLGKGSFATVYKCRQKEDGKLYAIKELQEPFSDLKKRALVVNEVKILECMPAHPNIVGFKRAWQEEKKLFLATELCQGDLQTFLKNLVQASSVVETPYLQPEKVPEELCWNVMVDMLQAASHLHKNGVLHLDIKLENIFTGLDDGRFKLGDFGSAWYFSEKNAQVQEGDGRYAAPETLRSIYTPQADTYSIGVSILQLALGIINPRHARYQDQWAELRLTTSCWEEKYSEEMKEKSQLLWDTIKLLLIFNHELRPTPAEMLENLDIISRIAEREKQLAKNKSRFRFNSMFNNLLQLLTIICPRHLISKLRPYMRSRSPSTPENTTSMIVVPSTPRLSFEEHRFNRESFRASSTPSRLGCTYTESGDEEDISTGRVNLTSKFSDMEASEDDEDGSYQICLDKVSPIKKLQELEDDE